MSWAQKALSWIGVPTADDPPLVIDNTQRVYRMKGGRNVQAHGNQPSARPCPSCPAGTGHRCKGLQRGFYHRSRA